MPRSSTPITSLRIPEDVLERIDKNAEREGMSRTDYILSWLPENHEQPDLSSGKTAAVRKAALADA